VAGVFLLKYWTPLIYPAWKKKVMEIDMEMAIVKENSAKPF